MLILCLETLKDIVSIHLHHLFKAADSAISLILIPPAVEVILDKSGDKFFDLSHVILIAGLVMRAIDEDQFF